MINKHIKIFIFIYVLGFSSMLLSQPEWYRELPQGFAYDYFKGMGSSTSKSEAAQLAFEDAVISIMNNNTVKIELPKFSIENLGNEKISADSLNSIITRKTVIELKLSNESKTIKGLRTYKTEFEQEGRIFNAYVLLSLPKKNPIPSPSSLSPIWRSIFVPGWGQLYKGETFKGVSFIVLTLGGVAGGFVFKQLSQDATNKANSSRTQASRDFYNQQTKDYDTYSKISFITAAVFYVWNLIDAIAVKQSNFYAELNGTKNIQICYRYNF